MPVIQYGKLFRRFSLRNFLDWKNEIRHFLEIFSKKQQLF
jgi:hypothetical protein